jgi:hypothetical protein
MCGSFNLRQCKDLLEVRLAYDEGRVGARFCSASTFAVADVRCSAPRQFTLCRSAPELPESKSAEPRPLVAPLRLYCSSVSYSRRWGMRRGRRRPTPAAMISQMRITSDDPPDASFTADRFLFPPPDKFRGSAYVILA